MLQVMVVLVGTFFANGAIEIYPKEFVRAGSDELVSRGWAELLVIPVIWTVFAVQLGENSKRVFAAFMVAGSLLAVGTGWPKPSNLQNRIEKK